jgi:hypothetical protein
VDAPDLARAVDAAVGVARAVGLPVEGAVVLQDSNKVAVRVVPGDVVARVANERLDPAALAHARFEIDLALALARVGSPAAALDPRVEPVVHRRDGFAMTLWTYYEPIRPEVPPGAYAGALEQLHAAMRRIDLPAVRFTDRVAEAQRIVGSPDASPALEVEERELIAGALERLLGAVLDHGAPEQLLHGEPHHGNVISAAHGPRFVDLETCCRGPVAFDLAHVPSAVADRCAGIDPALLGDCRGLVLAMVAAWRWVPGDQLPNGPGFGRELLHVLRAGPPWPTLDQLVGRPDAR